MEKNKWNKFKEVYKNNLLTLNIFLFFFNFFYIFSFYFLSHIFLSNFMGIKYSLVFQ